jgi:hypothetical protein
MVPSSFPDASVLPSGLKATLSTGLESVNGGAEGFWVVISHKKILPSLLPAARVLPSGLKPMLNKLGKGSFVSCGIRRWPMGFPVATLNIRISFSFSEARVFPSRL